MAVRSPLGFFRRMVSGLGASVRAQQSRRKKEPLPSGKPGQYETIRKSKEQRKQCPEHRRLLQEFSASMQELISLHYDQVAAARNGTVDLSATDDLIKRAERRKDQNKRVLLAHIREHGCSEQNEDVWQ